MLAAGLASFLWVRRLSLRHFDPRRFGFGILYSFSLFMALNTPNGPSTRGSEQSHSPRLRLPPHVGQTPRHSSEQSSLTGNASATCSQNRSFTSTPAPS